MYVSVCKCVRIGIYMGVHRYVRVSMLEIINSKRLEKEKKIPNKSGLKRNANLKFDSPNKQNQRYI